MNLYYITNNPEVASFVTSNGVNRVFVDLERIGKNERQGHLNTFISSHSIDDVSVIRSAIASKSADLLVRCNPWGSDSKEEIDSIVEQGADVIMLPMFTTVGEVEQFIEAVNGRAKVNLLLETPLALARLNGILNLSEGIDEIHIGLNDLHLGLGLDFMFEILTGGLLDFLADKIHNKGVDFGFGGIAQVGKGAIPAEYILGEHVRLCSSAVILSRSFNFDRETSFSDSFKAIFIEEIKKLRSSIQDWRNQSTDVLLQNKENVELLVNKFLK